MTSFSVVTVVYNDISHIIETMDSILEQSYKQIEYILIDGGSTDGTKEKIIERISSCADITLEESKEGQYYLEATYKDHPTLTFKFLCEKDKGIFDAMNKGVALATKEWINFMNCGDRFYDLKVLEKLANMQIKYYDIIYGDTEIVFTNCNTRIARNSHTDLNLLYRLFSGFCHQSSFIKASLHKAFPYSLEYRLASDYDFFYRCYKLKKEFLHIDQIIATFIVGGSSDQNAWSSLREAIQISLKYNTSFFDRIKVLLYAIFAFFKKTIKLYLSPTFIKHFLHFYSNKNR